MMDKKAVQKATLMKPLYWFMGFCSGIAVSEIVGAFISNTDNWIFLVWLIATFIISFVSSVLFIRKAKENTSETEWELIESDIQKLYLVMVGEIVFVIFVLKILISKVLQN